MSISQSSSALEKVAFFKTYFRGRSDVFARRFENRKSGKSGYSPACQNEWAWGICEKPRVKCSACPNQVFYPLSEEAVRMHLTGRDDAGKAFVMGLYPMLLDESCWLLAMDFDRADWETDIQAPETLRLNNWTVFFRETNHS